jgi:transcription elongation GreA/GreB family factor
MGQTGDMNESEASIQDGRKYGDDDKTDEDVKAQQEQWTRIGRNEDRTRNSCSL